MRQAVFAIGSRGEFGLKEGLPWPKLEGELPHFKNVTKNTDLIMGFNTFTTLPFAPTVNRRFVVVTEREKRPDFENLLYRSIKNIKHVMRHTDTPDMSIIGGTSLLTPDILELCDRVLVTHVKGEFRADTFLPQETQDWLNEHTHVNLYDKTDEYTILEYING